MMDAPHLSVLLDEVVEALDPKPGDVIVDGTFGAGGYSRAFLARGAEVIGFDRDPTVRPHVAALEAAYPGKFAFVGRRFSEMAEELEGRAPVQGVALDIGVSSMQLDQAERGFSFMRDGPLDMRMGDEGPSAADLVNTEDAAELARIFWVYGEERSSRHIANVLVRRRQEQPFERTLDLADTVERALGGRRGAPVHPATRVFQALRIAVNDELGELERGLEAAEQILAPGGRLAVVTFHSLEDRIVKSFLTERSGRLPAGSRHLPPSAKGPEPTFELLFKGARESGPDELAANPRARSAKLRAARRTAVPARRAA
ncbi:16S rRNA (cytosine(1402)-N(4))-methyltransferase RsmH [Caulobacter sp. 17J65-9]|uniref:16S rRNA (cytosine(1402)-N(4))-methyltransferase RsmH n=1 Tax=Caulobacter sp. 17J65-9 TaxID=2709382 RepID=UPI0013CB6BDE|nr:16S rRNA (cytosine(1402)-N(4))-methyltransferase RsmH [Caulobacter sp. 17J65-9]